MTRVMVDPGHGGKDPGAIGRDPFTVRESEVAWTVAALLRSALAQLPQLAIPGLMFSMT